MLPEINLIYFDFLFVVWTCAWIKSIIFYDDFFLASSQYLRTDELVLSTVFSIVDSI